jgi:hypothetical protein
MGKYENSEIHDRYSDWHYNLTKIDPKYNILTCTDIDTTYTEEGRVGRYWMEIDWELKKTICVMDLKWMDSDDNVTETAEIAYVWFESKGLPVYIVWIQRDFKLFKVSRFGSENPAKEMNELKYANFLLALRNIKQKLYIKE